MRSSQQLNGKAIFSIGITLFIALIITLVSVPTWLQWVMPCWVFMILLYWSFFKPAYVGIGVVWCVGLVVDLATGSLLGQHALVYTLITFFVLRFHPRVHKLPSWQQSLMIFLLVMLNLALQYWVMAYAGLAPKVWAYWLPAVTSMIAWPLLKEFLQRLNE